jgi:hypothetical protein
MKLTAFARAAVVPYQADDDARRLVKDGAQWGPALRVPHHLQ